MKQLERKTAILTLNAKNMNDVVIIKQNEIFKKNMIILFLFKNTFPILAKPKLHHYQIRPPVVVVVYKQI